MINERSERSLCRVNKGMRKHKIKKKRKVEIRLRCVVVNRTKEIDNCETNCYLLFIPTLSGIILHVFLIALDDYECCTLFPPLLSIITRNQLR